MKVILPLKEMTVLEKIGIMEDIWSDLSSAEEGYSPPDWHDRILQERLRLAESGEVGSPIGKLQRNRSKTGFRENSDF